MLYNLTRLDITSKVNVPRVESGFRKQTWLFFFAFHPIIVS